MVQTSFFLKRRLHWRILVIEAGRFSFQPAFQTCYFQKVRPQWNLSEFAAERFSFHSLNLLTFLPWCTAALEDFCSCGRWISVLEPFLTCFSPTWGGCIEDFLLFQPRNGRKSLLFFPGNKICPFFWIREITFGHLCGFQNTNRIFIKRLFFIFLSYARLNLSNFPKYIAIVDNFEPSIVDNSVPGTGHGGKTNVFISLFMPAVRDTTD